MNNTADAAMRSKQIRLYALTGARTQPHHLLLMETLISATPPQSPMPESLTPQSKAVYELAHKTMSIAELAAHLTIPLGVIRVLISDLANQGMVSVHPTGFTYQYDQVILERILDGLKNYPRDASPLTISAKIVVAGGFGVGKTTFMCSVSEVEPISTEAWMTVAGKTSTMVAMDFGRITLHPDLVLFLFSTPDQPRFWFLWDDLCRGALGAIVLVNTQRIQDSFAAINYFENDSDIPFIVAVNTFDGEPGYELDEIREALALSPDVPLRTCDAREPGSTAITLQELVFHTLDVGISPTMRPAPGS